MHDMFLAYHNRLWIPGDDWDDDEPNNDRQRDSSASPTNLSTVIEGESDETDVLSHLGGANSSLFGFGMGHYGGKSARAQKIPILIPAAKHLGGDVLMISCGTSNSAAIVAGVGLLTWGRGTHGQLGHGDTESQNQPRVVEALSGQSIIQIACGRSFMICITAEGKVYSWGRGGHGRLGNGATINQLCPSLVHGLTDRRIVSIAAGGGHALAVDDTGAVLSWGQGRSGQLGYEVGGEEEQFSSTPRRVAALSPHKIARVSCGHSHSMALSDCGDVFSFGAEHNGVLGHGDTDARFCTRPRKVKLPGKSTSIACGGFHSAAVLEGGLLYTWGQGSNGALGHGSKKIDELWPRMVESLVDVPIVFVSCGDWHTACVAGSGQLFSFGSADSGQLGLASATRQVTPQPVTSLRGKTVSAVSCGGGHTLAIVRQNAYDLKNLHSGSATAGRNERKRGPGDQMMKLKELVAAGNAYFSASEFREATERYDSFLRESAVAKEDADLSSSQQRDLRHMVTAVKLNMCVCWLKQGHTKSAIRCCDDVLKMSVNDSIKAKTYTRRGRAHLAEEEWELAKQDFILALKANPENGEARKILLELMTRQHKSRDANMYPKSLSPAALIGLKGPKSETSPALSLDEEVDTVLFPEWNPLGAVLQQEQLEHSRYLADLYASREPLSPDAPPLFFT